MFVEQSTQEFRVLLVVSTADLANTVERAECAGVSLSSEHHHLFRVYMHSNVLQDRDAKLMSANTGRINHDLIELKCDIVALAFQGQMHIDYSEGCIEDF